MKKQMMLMALCAMAVLFSGCVSNTTYNQDQQIINQRLASIETNVTQINAEVTKKNSQPQPQPIPVPPPKPVVVNAEVTVLADYHDQLRVHVSGEGATDAERKLADKLVFEAKGGVATAKTRVMEDINAADVVLRIRPELKTIDHDGNYWRMNCDVRAELYGTNSDRMFATKSFKYVSPQRVLGLDKAISQFEGEASKAVANWCAKEMYAIMDKEIAVSQVTITLHQNGSPRDLLADSHCIMKFGEGFKKMRGLISYELTGRDETKGTCTYRLAYFRVSYPNGIDTATSVMANEVARHK